MRPLRLRHRAIAMIVFFAVGALLIIRELNVSPSSSVQSERRVDLDDFRPVRIPNIKVDSKEEEPDTPAPTLRPAQVNHSTFLKRDTVAICFSPLLFMGDSLKRFLRAISTSFARRRSVYVPARDSITEMEEYSIESFVRKCTWGGGDILRVSICFRLRKG